MPITAWDHYTVRSKDATAAWAFYEQALGLSVRAREGFRVPAFIVSIGDPEVVHVFQASPEMEAIFAKLPPADQLQGWNTGRLHHVEFWATDLTACARGSQPTVSQSRSGRCPTSTSCR